MHTHSKLEDHPAIQTLRESGASIAIAPGNKLVQVSFKPTLPTGHHPDATMLYPTTGSALGSKQNWEDVAGSLRDLADRVPRIRIELDSMTEAKGVVDALPDTLSSSIATLGKNWYLVEIPSIPENGE